MECPPLTVQEAAAHPAGHGVALLCILPAEVSCVALVEHIVKLLLDMPGGRFPWLARFWPHRRTEDVLWGSWAGVCVDHVFN